MNNLYFLIIFIFPILSYSQVNNKLTENEFINSLIVEKNYAKAYTFFDETVKN